MALSPAGSHTSSERLIELTQELLDAHCDTVCLAGEPPSGPRWSAHVDYLRALQRVAHQAMAELTR